MSTREIFIRRWEPRDTAPVVALLRTASPEYVQYFRPFEFETEAVERLARRAQKDRWFVIELTEDDGTATLAGFYMLRGVDEGFADPMYGVFIAEECSGTGLARLTLAHAEAMCAANAWPNLLLKVDPANTRAFALYQAAGFHFLRVDPANGNQVLSKPSPAPFSKHDRDHTPA